MKMTVIEKKLERNVNNFKFPELFLDLTLP